MSGATPGPNFKVDALQANTITGANNTKRANTITLAKTKTQANT